MSKEFLGRGWKFPVRLSATGSIDESQNEVDIKEAIKIIATTAMGERVMLPDFGCGIYNYVFESPNATMLGLIEDSVRTAMIKWEPRIVVNNVSVSMEGSEKNKLLIELNYTVRSTNNQYNLVYPFYLKE